MKKTPTPEQHNIIAAVFDGNKHIKVKAAPGSGKSFTSNQIIAQVEQKLPRIKMLATTFGKDNAKDLKTEKVKSNVIVNNIHSLLWQLIKKRFPTLKVVNDAKHIAVIKSLGGTDETYALAKMCKYYYLDKAEQIELLAKIYGFENPRVEVIRKYFMYLRQKFMSIGITYDDMLYLGYYLNNALVLELPKFQIILGDEVQDFERLTKLLLVRMLDKGGKMIMVGDNDQAIFQFKGADSSGMDFFSEKNHFREFPLSVTQRLPSQIVDFTQQATGLAKEMKARSDNDNGIIAEASYRDIRVGDMVLARNNDVLMTFMYHCKENGIPFHFSGSLYKKVCKDKSKVVYISTIHAAKGMESDRVFIIGDNLIISDRSTKKWEVKQDLHCMFVAYTRAKKSLYFVKDFAAFGRYKKTWEGIDENSNFKLLLD